MDETPGEKPTLHIDEDWKSQAQAEKEQLERAKAAQSQAEPAKAEPSKAEPPKSETEPVAKPAEAARSRQPAGHDRQLPPPTLVILMTTLATQAMMLLGQIPDPMSGKAEVDLPQAQHFIDTLAMLEQKTTGNRTPEESRLLDNLMHELRMAFVQVSARSGAPQA
jgi:hypothetical protein